MPTGLVPQKHNWSHGRQSLAQNFAKNRLDPEMPHAGEKARAKNPRANKKCRRKVRERKKIRAGRRGRKVRGRNIRTPFCKKKGIQFNETASANLEESTRSGHFRNQRVAGYGEAVGQRFLFTSDSVCTTSAMLLPIMKRASQRQLM